MSNTAALALQPALPLDLSQRPANDADRDHVAEWAELVDAEHDHEWRGVRVVEATEVRHGVRTHVVTIEREGALRFALSMPAGRGVREQLRSACRSWARARGLHVSAWASR